MDIGMTQLKQKKRFFTILEIDVRDDPLIFNET
jgi:hypothetical protein